MKAWGFLTRKGRIIPCAFRTRAQAREYARGTTWTVMKVDIDEYVDKKQLREWDESRAALMKWAEEHNPRMIRDQFKVILP